MRSDAPTVEAYLAAQRPERRATLAAALALVRGAMPAGYAEAMRWGMIVWEVPPEVSGPTYNGAPLMYAGLAGQKRHVALYLCGLACRPDGVAGLREAFAAAGKRLDMGAACLRFRSMADLVPEAVAAALAATPPADFAAAARR